MELIMTRLFSDTRSTTFDQLAPNSSLACQHLMLIKKNVQGFSLIELMVAVGIMGGMTTLAVPQYGKYKIKAAQTEVKATLANIHGAQELHLVDKNYYAVTLAALSLDKSVPAKHASSASDFNATDAGQNFVYGNQKLSASGDATGTFHVSKDGTATAIAAGATTGVEYRIVATAIRKLASCAAAEKLEAWCLNNNKLITNKANDDAFSKGGTSNKRCADQTEDTATGQC